MNVKTLACLLSLLLFTLPSITYADSKSDDIVSTAKDYIGVPYVFGGESSKGFDCSGYSSYVFAKHGVDLPRTASQQYNVGTKISKDELQRGDLVFFETYKPGPSHLGIYVGSNKFIHASSSNGVSISDLNEAYWKKRYIGSRRVLKKEEQQQEIVNTLYKDITNNHWAFKEIEYLTEQGIYTGSDKKIFQPDDPITKEIAAILLSRAVPLEITTFKTVNDLNYAKYGQDAILKVVNAEIMSLDKDGNFNPNQELTREEIAVLFTKAFSLNNNDESGQAFHFDDVDQSAPSHDAIQEITKAGITTGYEDETFKPEKVTNRAEFAVFLYRALNL